jgi:hypothetical protein
MRSYSKYEYLGKYHILLDEDMIQINYINYLQKYFYKLVGYV